MTCTKAVIMVGGGSRGTRFRPLALDGPKILFPVAGAPLLQHTIDAVLQIETIEEIILCGFHEPSVFTDFISQFDARMKYMKRQCKIRYLQEFKALGTAGGLYYFRNEIMEGDPESFLVIHGDIVCSFPLAKMLAFYDEKSKESSSKLDAVLFGVKISDYDMFLAINDRDQSSFGTIVYEKDTDKVVHFVQKAETRMSTVINGGIYIFNSNLFKRLSHAKVSKITAGAENGEFDVDEDVISMEKDVLENLPEFGSTYVYLYDDFWTAVKTPSDALYANRLYLNEEYKQQKDAAKGHKRTPTVDVINLEKPSLSIQTPVYIHPTAKVDYTEGTKIGTDVSISKGCSIGPGTRIINSIILDGCQIARNSYIANSIISYNSKVGEWCRIEGTGLNMPELKELAAKGLKPEHKESRVIGIRDSGNISILGSGTVVKKESYILNSFILPNKTIKHDVKFEIIM